jgi:predicted peptidase
MRAIARTYLTGFSYGGNGVLEIGVRQPDVWAALWPVEPTRPPERSADRPIWVSAGQRARKHKEAFRNVWRVQDRVRPNAAPHPERVYEDRGFHHVRTAIEAYREGDIYDWLLTH